MADPRVDIHYNCAANANATTRRNSLTGDGPLKVHTSHYFAVAFPQSHKTTVGGDVIITYHACEYLTSAWLKWSEPIEARNLAWYILPEV